MKSQSKQRKIPPKPSPHKEKIESLRIENDVNCVLGFEGLVVIEVVVAIVVVVVVVVVVLLSSRSSSSSSRQRDVVVTRSGCG
ncbi:hypothetical protein ElyMa_001430800 [Elysia marginata]|uniref:Transmembrane protein n=1 Tax=Elysia marginata TaxID=1093978 RepID=A0AAV4J0D1_9GAST|nr:hypothetical protein ElyMa_001430800 [Elysia marginata]